MPPGRPTRTLTIHAISSPFLNEDINALISTGLDGSLRLTIPLTFFILLFAFGAIVAAVVPLVLAITALLAAFGILGIYSQIVGSVSPNATQLIVLIGLAVAVDYSLFMITRFRVERRASRDRLEGDRGLEQHRGPGGLLLRAGGDDLARRADHPRRVAVHVDGDRDDLGRPRLGHRQPDVPAGDAGDPRRPGEPRPPATWLPWLASNLPFGPVRRWGRTALRWLDWRGARPEGSGFWATLVNGVMARPVAR